MCILAGMTKLSAYLEGARLTQAQFAAKIDVTQATVSKLCAGTMQPGPELAVLIEQHTKGAVRVEDWDRFAVLKHRLVPESEGGE